MSSNHDATKKIGENLLKGWTLLGDVCPKGCNIPLMRSRDKQHLICFACDTDFMQPENEGTNVEPHSPASNAAQDSTMGGKPSTSRSKKAIKNSVDSKLEWIAKRLEQTENITELRDLAATAKELISLRRDIESM